jgi:branched-chain amino acid aminotransferase
MIDNAGTMLMKNGRLYSAEAYGDDSLPSSGIVYEVIRIINGIPLFLEDHYQRLENSLGMLGIKITFSYDILLNMLQTLVNANGLSDCNVKLLIYNNMSGNQDSLLYVSKSYYPTKDEYARGVPISLFYRSRSNPNAKIIDSSYKEAAAAKIAQDKVFEVLLVNDEGILTEGSRSNLFLVKGNTVLTAPDSYVLKGITRQYILEACNDSKITISENRITADDLIKMDGLFISGTSIKVLPVSNVGNIAFPSSKNRIISTIGNRYNEIIHTYLKLHNRK